MSNETTQKPAEALKAIRGLGRPKFDEIEPLHDYVLIRRDRKDRTEGGLVVPESVRDRDGDGRVIAIGPDVEHVCIDDRVMIDPNSECFEMPEDRAVCLVKEESIIARAKKGSR